MRKYDTYDDLPILGKLAVWLGLWTIAGVVMLLLGWVHYSTDTWQYTVLFFYAAASCLVYGLAALFAVAYLIGALWRTIRWAAGS
jgi:hypothetical protein